MSTEDSKVFAPNHYTKGGLEVFTILEKKLSEREVIGAYKANVLKYVFRAGMKGPELRDYRKALVYLMRLVDFLETQEESEK